MITQERMDINEGSLFKNCFATQLAANRYQLARCNN